MRGTLEVDLAVVGAGLAGLGAALFAARRGLGTVVVGGTGEIGHAAGPLDVLDVHPVAEGRTWDDPFAGIARLVADLPDHPYARVGEAVLRRAMEETCGALGEVDLPYRTLGGRNAALPTPLGTLKRAWAVPATMATGAAALASGRPAVLVDLAGITDCSMIQAAAGLSARWPGLRVVALDVGGPPSGGASREHLARGLDLPEGRRTLAARLRPHLGAGEAVGLPAVVGLVRHAEALADLQDRLATDIFEIPTPPVSVPGLRLQRAFERLLGAAGVRLLRGRRVEAIDLDPAEIRLHVPEVEIRARGVILATGRFFGGGLAADRTGVRETLLGLPVTQPPRADWFRHDLLDRRGHPLNQAGIEVDDRFRPLGRDGEVVHPHLHAVGSVLAHQDWMRTRSGAGLALGTALAAVRSLTGEAA